MLDWVLSIKDKDFDADFNDLMLEDYNTKRETGGMNPMTVSLINAGYDRVGADSSVDNEIDNNDAKTEQTLKDMREFYGEEQIAKMSPSEFYINYKKFASGLIF